MTTKNQMLKMVRLNCCECLGGPRAHLKKWPVTQVEDIAGCTAPLCIWYPFRFGKDPSPERKSVPPSEKQLEARRKFGTKRPRINANLKRLQSDA